MATGSKFPTYNPPLRNKFNVWSYTDDRAPPGKTSAHSDPMVSSVIGWTYWPIVHATAEHKTIVSDLQRKNGKF